MKVSYVTDNLVPRSPRSCGRLRKWRLRDRTMRGALRRVRLKLTDKRQSLKRKENWLKLLLLGIQTGDKLAKPPFFVAYSRLYRHCRYLAEGGCLVSRFHFRLCRYFLGHVACRNLRWQGLRNSLLQWMSWKNYELKKKNALCFVSHFRFYLTKHAANFYPFLCQNFKTMHRLLFKVRADLNNLPLTPQKSIPEREGVDRPHYYQALLTAATVFAVFFQLHVTWTRALNFPSTWWCTPVTAPSVVQAA